MYIKLTLFEFICAIIYTIKAKAVSGVIFFGKSCRRSCEKTRFSSAAPRPYDRTRACTMKSPAPTVGDRGHGLLFVGLLPKLLPGPTCQPQCNRNCRSPFRSARERSGSAGETASISWRDSQHRKSKKFLRMRTRKPRSNLGDVINERGRWDLHTLEEITQRKCSTERGW
jgi:hypothetical protein